MRNRFSWLLPASLLLACGGGTTTGNGAGGAGGSAGGGSGGAAAGTSSSSCPAEPPKSGSSCTGGSGTGFALADCSWGDDPRPGCRVAAVCTNGAWSVTQPPADCAATPALPAACPAAPPAEAATCADSKLACWYADGTICNCSGCQGGAAYPICRTIDPPQWACKVLDPFCPNPLPQAGSKCDVPDVNCGPSCEQPIRCQNGTWHYGQAMCPMCAAPSTPIATPAGERAISELTPGDLVYSVDESGVVVVPILRVGSTPVVNHRVVRVELTGGAVLEISAGHPTADGRTFADLLGGGQLDRDHVIVSAEMVPYAYARTYDILPGSPSGAYFAGGALIGSTLAR